MRSSLEHGDHAECGAWLAVNDGVLRAAFSSARPAAIATIYTLPCFDSKTIKATNKEARVMITQNKKRMKKRILGSSFTKSIKVCSSKQPQRCRFDPKEEQPEKKSKKK